MLIKKIAGRKIIFTFIFIILMNNSINCIYADNSIFDNVQTIDDNSGEILSVEWSPDGSKFASGSSDGIIKIFNSMSEKTLQVIHDHDNYAVRVISWNPNGTIIASGSCDNRIKLWNALTGEQIRIIDAHVQCIQSISWSPNGFQFAAGYSTHTNRTQIWDFYNGTILATLDGQEASIQSVRWNPNGSMIATGAQRVRIWNTTDWTSIILLPKDQAVRIAEWSPDGKWLVSENGYFEITLWDTNKWTRVYNSSEQASQMNSISWAPDNSRVAIGLEDHSVLIWDMQNKSFLKILTGHTDEVTSVDWSPDGKRIISGSRDGTIKIWGELQPDVHLISLTANKYDIIVGEEVIFTIKLSNFGLGDGLNKTVYLFDGVQLLNGQTVNISHEMDLQITIPWKTTNKINLGIHEIRATLDKEEKGISLKIHGTSNLFIKDFKANKKEIRISETIIFTTHIGNNGTENAVNAKIDLLENGIVINTKITSIPMDGESTLVFEWNSINQSIGSHHFRVMAGTAHRELEIIINPRLKTSVESPYLCMELFLFLIVGIILICGYHYKKSVKSR